MKLVRHAARWARSSRAGRNDSANSRIGGPDGDRECGQAQADRRSPAAGQGQPEPESDHVASGPAQAAVADDDLAVGVGRDACLVGDDDDGRAGLGGGAVSSSMTCSPARESREPVGSSAKMTAGSATSARAIATRWA